MKAPETFCTVIIPARNEEKNIAACLNSILKQKYNSDLLEVIFVDDNSTDSTVDIVKAMAAQSDVNIRIITMGGGANETYKKNAITKAVREAKGKLIITTDADCTMGPEWVRSIATFYETEHPKMICCGVQFVHDNNWFQRFQSLEFIGLNICTAGAISVNSPIMCNGANLSYEKDIFLEMNGYEGSGDIPSGDDSFLMLSIHEKYKKGVMFLKSREAIVYTEAKPDWASFVQQRKRWASKTRFYKNNFVKLVGVLVLIANAAFLAALPALFIYPQLSIAIISAKLTGDFILLFAGTIFFRRKLLLLNFLPEQICYAVYVWYITLISPFGTYSWKERTVKA